MLTSDGTDACPQRHHILLSFFSLKSSVPDPLVIRSKENLGQGSAKGLKMSIFAFQNREATCPVPRRAQSQQRGRGTYGQEDR